MPVPVDQRRPSTIVAARKCSFVDAMKIRYRPLICPFRDLLHYSDGSDRIADIGCGSGQFALMLANHASASSIHGVEVNDRLIENANAGLRAGGPIRMPVHFRVFDGLHLPDDMRKCDLYYLIDVLHHIPAQKQTAFLEQLYETMPAGSRLVLKDIDAASPLVVFNKLHDLLLSGCLGHEWSETRARLTCERIGFTLLEVQRKRMFLYPHYILHLEKPMA